MFSRNECLAFFHKLQHYSIRETDAFHTSQTRDEKEQTLVRLRENCFTERNENISILQIGTLTVKPNLNLMACWITSSLVLYSLLKRI